jgi:hypothetical protein
MTSMTVSQTAAPSEFDGRPITGADLRALIEREQVLRGSYVIPTAKALEELAKAVNVLRGRVRTGSNAYLTPEQLLNDQRRACASKALAMLASVLPGLREGILDAPDVGPPKISELMRLGQLSQLDTLQDMVNEAWDYSWITPHQELSIQIVEGADWATQHSGAYAAPPPSPDREIREIHTWHNFATFLADKFRDVVQASNPGLQRLKIGNSEAPNPVVCFLVAVIPHITGERPPAAAVRKWLQRQSTRDKPT